MKKEKEEKRKRERKRERGEGRGGAVLSEWPSCAHFTPLFFSLVILPSPPLFWLIPVAHARRPRRLPIVARRVPRQGKQCLISVNAAIMVVVASGPRARNFDARKER